MERCTTEDIRYNERQYHSYPVTKTGEPIDLADEYPHVEPDYQPYSCSKHGEDFFDWPEVVAHIKRIAAKSPAPVA
jgi:hypothetical protein